MGIKNLETWNEALLAKNLWNLASKKDYLWVKWVHMMRLKDQNIWNTQFNVNDSWNWKCLLEVRDKIASRLQYEVGNGRQIQMWSDRWHSSGLLIKKITYKDLYDARMPRMIKLADMIDEGKWKWPSEWRNNDLEVMKIQVPKLKNDVKDIVKWKGDNDELVPFHIKWVMKSLNATEEKVKWYELVWFKWCISKHSFCLWTAMIGRLLTQDKIMAWGTKTGLLCSLCKKVNDSHDHLFFLCDYSKDMCNRLAPMMNMTRTVYKWDEVERNQRLFRGENRDPEILFKAINEVIKLKLMNIRVGNSAKVWISQKSQENSQKRANTDTRIRRVQKEAKDPKP
ncbi:RNA-directed DNA polymerase, eukaryota, reverse transcriptase zinc-binding domain protein [Tanacetum coccineum]